MDQSNQYEGAITLVMPGQSKPGTYRIRVDAPDRVTAHALIEDIWKEKLSEYSITVAKVKAGSPAPTGSEQ